jgi:hypothetical protein
MGVSMALSMGLLWGLTPGGSLAVSGVTGAESAAREPVHGERAVHWGEFMRLTIFVLVAFVAGCAMTNERVSRNLASGEIGCPADSITIENETASFDGSHNFEAICKGQRFFCHYHQTSGIDCKEELQ